MIYTGDYTKYSDARVRTYGSTN